MAKSVADYLVLSDARFEIDSVPDGEIPIWKEFDFSLPNDFVAGTVKARPILQFIFAARSREGKFGFWINYPEPTWPTPETQHGQYQWDGRLPTEISTWECVQGDIFRAGGDNVLRFGFGSGQFGTIWVRDVVLWFQRYVED